MTGGYRVATLILAFVILTGSSFAPHLNAKTRLDRHSSSSSIFQREIILKPGEWLDAALSRAGVSANQRSAIETALKASRDPRRLATGSRLIMRLQRGSDRAMRLVALHLDLNRHADITLLAQADGQFDAAQPQPAAIKAARAPTTSHSIAGLVGADFNASLMAAGVSANIAQEIHDVFVYDPDFPAQPPAGSSFDVVIDGNDHAADRPPVDRLRSVSVTVRGRTHSVYRYPVGNGLVAFVEPNGLGVLQAHLAKPVTDARISSPWGWRIHPILGRPEFHKGIDMAAPMGAPVLAAADGTVAFAGRSGNNGVLIKLEHTGQLMTAYSHLQRVATGLRPGFHVTKGQVIGYVGETGLATGPHLYYEVYIAGEQVNPSVSDLALPFRLTGNDLRRLQKLVVADARSSR
jgi:murein DD-endopeptidase MepM/ murein hydrolase activator NlpD